MTSLIVARELQTPSQMRFPKSPASPGMGELNVGDLDLLEGVAPASQRSKTSV